MPTAMIEREITLALDQLQRSRRTKDDLLKKLTCLGYWKDLEAARAIGYLGPVSVAGGVPNLGNAPMPQDERKP